jgi:uncharacterized protein YjiS (DUF1127 family)
VGLLGVMYEWVRARVEKDELSQLSDRELKDIGLYRHEFAGLRTDMYGS